MKQRPRIYYTQSQKALMWERWKKGEFLQQISQLFDRNHSSVHRILAETGGIRPPERCRSRLALTLAEREEISRAVVAGQSIRSIAILLKRAPSTISREIGRNGANPELMRLALKLATGAGKTTVMAMLIAWQTINAVRRPTSKNFTRGFLVCAPGLTIKDRLRVLQPNDPNSYYKDRELLPNDMLDDMGKAKIVITNYHAFKMRERIELSKGGRQLLQGRTGDAPLTLETEGQMLQRVMPDLMGIKNIMVINDEAHHCYREKPTSPDEEDLKGDEKKEAEKNSEAARLWISGLEAVNRKLGVTRVLDLSATPFFLSGSGYAEGSLVRLTGDEQKAVKTTAFDLQLNPAHPSMSLHRIEQSKDKNFWSVRAGNDIRIIVHKAPSSLMLCYADHHDKAYDWAARRKLVTHPTTGAAQLVEVRETVQQVLVPVYVQTELALTPPPSAAAKLLFADRPNDELLGYGVPAEWLNDVKGATEATLLALADHLPAEAAEALLELATGGKPRVPQPAVATANPFDHPDAQRRFRVMTNLAELQTALDFPWEKWTVFLHPEQRQWVERDYTGPARVSGSVGTGKTIVALHRAVYLARSHPEARVLLTTFSDTLASALHTKLKRLVGSEPRLAERIDVYSLNAIGLRLYNAQHGTLTLAGGDAVRQLLSEASKAVTGHKFSLHFLVTEWEQVVDAWQLATWQDYRDVTRLGRKTRLPEPQRAVLWSIFEQVRSALAAQRLTTHAGMFTALASTLNGSKHPPFDFAVVDEAQDLSVAHLRFLAALGANRPDGLFFAGDLGQRIFQQPFSWKSLGVDIRGRSRTLRINYRTSHQIRQKADRLLGPQASDVDGNSEIRSDTVSVFNGPPPVIRVLKSESEEIKVVGAWLAEQSKAGVLPHEFGVFVRSAAQLKRAQDAVAASGLPFKVLDEHVETSSGHVSIITMHLAKGLEFRAVVVMACDDEVIPLQERIETVGDDADLQEVYDTERHLLYVACTRARDHLLVTSVEPASEFLDDMRKN